MGLVSAFYELYIMYYEVAMSIRVLYEVEFFNDNIVYDFAI